MLRIMDNNYLDASNMTLSSEASGFPIENALDLDERGLLYRATADTLTIDVDLGAQFPVDYFAIVGDGQQALKLTPGATVTVKGNTIDDFSDPPLSLTLTVEDEGVFVAFASQILRYFEIEIDDTGSPNDVEFNYIYLGDSLTLPNNVKRGFQKSFSNPDRVSIADSGRAFGVRRQPLRTWSAMEVMVLPQDTVESLRQFIAEVGIARPFLIDLDPDRKFGAAATWAGAFRFAGYPQLNHEVFDRFTLAMSLEEQL